MKNTPSDSQSTQFLPDDELDALLASYGQPDPALSEKICLLCAADGRNRRIRRDFLFRLLSRAAILIIVAGIASVIGIRYGRSSSLSVPPSVVISSSGTPVDFSGDDRGFSLQDSLTLNSSQNTVQTAGLTHLQRVGTADNGYSAALQSIRSSQQAAAMPLVGRHHGAQFSFTHLWCVDKKTDIRGILPKNAVKASGNAPYGMQSYQLSLTAEECRKLVRRLHDDHHWTLLSNRQIQPEMETIGALSTQTVSYTMHILPQ